MDRVELAIFQGSLQELCSEMDTAIERAAFGPVIAESLDRASGLYERDSGSVIAQGQRGLPVFIGVMQYSVGSFIKLGIDYLPGDIFITNDPYLGGSHLMDVRLIAPYFFRDELVCFLANTAHWTDIGGAVPGGFSGSARSIHQEGLRLRPTRIVSQGSVVSDVKELILDNVRLPEEREGDLLAQFGGLDVGRRRLDAVIEKYGLETFRKLARSLGDYSERLMRACLERVPDGRYAAEDFLDNDGVRPEPLRIRCRLGISGDRASIDFSGSSPRCAGPLNSPEWSTRAAVLIALQHLFPTLPINHGTHRPIHIRIPRNSFLAATYPAAVAACAAEVPQRVIDTVLMAFGAADDTLAQGLPFSTSSNFTLYGTQESSEYLMYLFLGGGYGGHRSSDGLSNACSTISMAKTAAIEVLERRYPVRFDRYRLRNGSGGGGTFRGGLGVECEFSFLETEGEVSLLMDRGIFPPRGVLGGRPGSMSVFEIRQRNGDVLVPTFITKADRLPLRRGDRVYLATPGGGGYGSPEKRSDQLTQTDFRAAYV